MHLLFRDWVILRYNLDYLVLIELPNRPQQRLEADIAPVSANFELHFGIVTRFDELLIVIAASLAVFAAPYQIYV